MGHQENLVFTFLTFSLLFVLFCRKVEKAIPYTPAYASENIRQTSIG
jgi:hypothetical protein